MAGPAPRHTIVTAKPVRNRGPGPIRGHKGGQPAASGLERDHPERREAPSTSQFQDDEVWRRANSFGIVEPTVAQDAALDNAKGRDAAGERKKSEV